MNHQVFRRAAILKSDTQIDFDASDAADALNQRQLGFALLQDAIGAIAFARDFQHVLL